MAKLYWRVKKNGKWTWKPAEVSKHDIVMRTIVVHDLEEEE